MIANPSAKTANVHIFAEFIITAAFTPQYKCTNYNNLIFFLKISLIVSEVNLINLGFLLIYYNSSMQRETLVILATELIFSANNTGRPCLMFNNPMSLLL